MSMLTAVTCLFFKWKQSCLWYLSPVSVTYTVYGFFKVTGVESTAIGSMIIYSGFSELFASREYKAQHTITIKHSINIIDLLAAGFTFPQTLA